MAKSKNAMLIILLDGGPGGWMDRKMDEEVATSIG